MESAQQQWEALTMSEPVIAGLAPALITGAVAALANLALAFGLTITQAQVNAINAAVLPVMLVMAALGTWWARRKSTPVASPTLPQGTTVTVVTPGDSPNEAVVL
jgi:hypothetical protein